MQTLSSRAVVRRATNGRMLSSTIVVCAVTVFVAGCGDILSLKQSNPGQVDASTLYVPENAQLVVNGAIADFECAFTRYVAGSGIVSVEISAAIANTVNFDYDRRLVTPTSPYAGSCTSGSQQP